MKCEAAVSGATMTQHCDVRSQRISLGDDGIVRMTMQPGVYDLELTDAREVIQAVNSLSGGGRRPVRVALREVRSMSRDCRKYFAGPEHTSELQSRLHLVCRLL